MPNYEDYLEHFFDNAEASIREGKGQELSDNLSHIAELIHELIDKEVDSKDSSGRTTLSADDSTSSCTIQCLRTELTKI